MTHKIEGIIPVMLTPFTDQGEIDYPGLERLIEWYLEKGADALFAIAQSSEMQLLTLAERAALGHFVVKQVAGRVPVVVSGHISDDLSDQIEELTVAAETGADGIVLVTNHLDPKATGTETFRGNLTRGNSSTPLRNPRSAGKIFSAIKKWQPALRSRPLSAAGLLRDRITHHEEVDHSRGERNRRPSQQRRHEGVRGLGDRTSYDRRNAPPRKPPKFCIALARPLYWAVLLLWPVPKSKRSPHWRGTPQPKCKPAQRRCSAPVRPGQ
jgi:Dihydrodipicolinate synthetase family